MADIFLNADGFGAFSVATNGVLADGTPSGGLAANGEDDNVIVNIGTNFSGTIAAQSSPNDGEIEGLEVNLPPGWVITIDGAVTELTSETPSWKTVNYVVTDETGAVRGQLLVQLNRAPLVPCFTEHGLIRMGDGSYREIGTVEPGDVVQTLDNGPQKVLWIGKTDLMSDLGSLSEENCPVQIPKGVFGAYQDSLVSQNHCILVKDAGSDMLFDSAEVLVPAKSMVGVQDISLATTLNRVTYVHILFEDHQIVNVDGMWSESFYPDEYALSAVDLAARTQVISALKEVGKSAESYDEPARPKLRHFEGVALQALLKDAADQAHAPRES